MKENKKMQRLADDRTMYFEVPDAAAEGTSSSRADRAERAQCLAQLANLFGRKCETDYDKYQILDDRDKLIRKMTLKVSDISKATKKVGTCTEMCPEKERYQRIVQKRVSSFELADDHTTPEHALFIKDYSRSSADQEEPLSHELRPQRVLMCTMQQLKAIMDKCPPVTNEAALVIWFDFLWNRTRAIRKDLTQQLLCDATAVHLVECCARLHIFSGYHLSHISADNFSQKINTENLAKCLQTLRHFYSDLRSHKVACENEAEFRAFDIMLNLCDTDIVLKAFETSQIFSETRALDETVLKSPPVALALKMFIAVQSNNYARFFGLVRSRASAMQVAILHRHFYRIRKSGFRTLISTNKSRLSTANVQRLFAFESTEQTLAMALECGMQTVGGSSDTLSADKSLLYHSADESGPARLAERCDELMNSKMQGSTLSQLICDGGPNEHDTLVQLEAIMSFDEHNCYTRDPVLNAVLKDSVAADDEQMLASVREQERRELVSKIRTAQQHVLHSVIDAALDDALPPIVQRALHAEVVAEAERQQQLAERLHREQQELIRRRSQLVAHCAQRLIDDLCTETVSERVHKCALRAHSKQRLCAMTHQAAHNCSTQLLNELCPAFVMHIAQQVYERDVERVLERLAHIARRLRLLSARQAIAPYLKRLRHKIQAEHALDKIALIPPASGRIFDECALTRHLVPSLPSPTKQPGLGGTYSAREQALARRVLYKWRDLCSRKLPSFAPVPRRVSLTPPRQAAPSIRASPSQLAVNPVRCSVGFEQHMRSAVDVCGSPLPKVARFDKLLNTSRDAADQKEQKEAERMLDELRSELAQSGAFNEHCRTHIWPRYRALLSKDSSTT